LQLWHVVVLVIVVVNLSLSAFVVKHLKQNKCYNFNNFYSVFLVIFFTNFPQLKVQEAMRKKEKFQREHEEVSEKSIETYIEVNVKKWKIKHNKLNNVWKKFLISALG